MEKNRFVYLLVLLMPFLVFVEATAQNIKDELKRAKELADESKYNESYSILQKITEEQLKVTGDTGVAYYNYYKGSCLYFLKKYEEAIPVLQKGLLVMDKLQKKDCDYLEMLYGIGACYKEMKNYPKAEKFFRRTILKGTNMDLNCAIRNQTYREMAELYSLMGKPDFADICTSRIESEMRIYSTKDLQSQENVLWELYCAHEDLGRYEECIIDLNKLRHLIEENIGKNNNKYLTYSFLLGSHLRYRLNRPQEAASIHKEMVEIGKQFETNQMIVCSAYKDYLRYLSENNKVDSIKLILPSAINYYYSTEDKGDPENLYEIVGLGLCDAKNYEEGINYLEK